MASTGFQIQQGGAELAMTAYNANASATATAITKKVNEVTVSVADTDSVKLPAGMAQGTVLYIFNRDAAQDIKVWPNAGATIQGGADTTAVAVGQTQGLICVQAGTDGLTWLCFLGAVTTAS